MSHIGKLPTMTTRALPMTHKIIEANFFESFHLDRFYVTADLLGARHEFTFSGKAVTVELPLDQENSTTPHELRSVECYKWHSEGNIPLEYQVKRIAMRIAVGHSLSIPQEALKVSPLRDELFTNAEREQLDRLIDGREGIPLRGILWEDYKAGRIPVLSQP